MLIKKHNHVFFKIIPHYYLRLVRFAKEFVLQAEDAENITQNVFANLWEKRDSIEPYGRIVVTIY